VSIQKEGYVTYNSAVLPRPGIAQSVRIKLLTLEQHKWKNIKPLINTVAGSQLKLFKVDAKFSMGASRREQGRRSNEAIRPVQLTRAFYLGTSAVTNAEYREFVKQHSSGHVKGNSLNGEKYPVVNITWSAAAAYCNWLSEQENLTPFYQVENGEVTGINPQSNGYRMPTEAEWAWAARVKTDGSLLKFPWGSAFPITEKSGNYGDRRAAALLGNIQATYDDGYAVTAPKASFSANHNGLFDMGGNVAEWVSDYYGIKTGLSRRVDVDPTGPQQGSHHVIRGSSWAHGTVTDLRLAFRDYGSDKRTDLGFRVARYVD
jgi:formylglycine-generating enzyme required for sulfatase activity